jgi:hypothetical protein
MKLHNINKTKKQRIIYNIFDIMHNTAFKEEALKQYEKDVENMDINLNYGNDTMYYYGKNNKLLYTIKITN